jgi:mRNA interferase MazF
MKRGEVRWYEFQPPDKRRPVLVLTRDSVIPILHEITPQHIISVQQ